MESVNGNSTTIGVEKKENEMVGNKEEKKDVIAVDGSEEKSEMKEKGGEVEKESEGEKEVKEEEGGENEKDNEEEKEVKEEDNEEKNNESEENPKAEEIVDVKEEKSNDDEKEVNESNENETKEEEATKTNEEAGNEKQEEREETREEDDKNTTANEENYHETNDNNEENPTPSLAPNNHNTEETTNLELSNTTLPYSRRPRRTSPRTPYNDIYLNTRNRYRQAVEGEGRFVQHHKIKYYEGSHLDTTPRNRSALPVTDTFDFTVISQTTKERLFFFPYLLQRWKGPLSIAIMTNVTDTEEIETFIQSSNFPDRLRLALYITGLPGKTDCVYRRTSRGLRCVRATIYPLNRLRNIAIQNSLTSHFVVFDMDMWPAKHTYKTLRSLSPSYLANPFAVTIIPAFSLPPALLESAKCRSFRGCVTAIATRLPETKQQLVHCLRKRGCSIFRPKSLTHDYLPSNWETLPATTEVTFMKCFRQRFMEPYVMVRRTEQLPLFDERFINYGFNKVQWIENLRYLGFEFSVLSQAFAVDIPHSSSGYAKDYSKEFKERNVEMLHLYRRFLYELRTNSRDESRQLLCLPKNIDVRAYRF
ncbi:hypothetical protein WA588_000540 [Blastocystis sp. NMH]